MSLPRAILFASGVSLALACAGPPPPVQAPANESAALIAIKVALDKEGETERLYFVRLEDGETVIQDEVVSSNYFEDGYVYLLNAKPGRYVAVAAAKLTQKGHAPGPMTPVGGGFSVGASYNPGPRESVTFFPDRRRRGPGAIALLPPDERAGDRHRSSPRLATTIRSQ